jgi:VCBS repeat-containing protein
MNAQILSRLPIHQAISFGQKLLFLVIAVTLLALFAPHGEAQTIRRITAPGKFYVDDKDSNGVIYNYAVYTISNNTGINIPSTYVALTNIHPTNRIQLALTDNGVRTLGALAPGETKLAAFYLRGPSFTGNSDTLLNLTNETHSVQVWAGPPVVGNLLSSSNYSYTNIIFLIEAAANKVTVITNLNPLAILGSEVVLVIAGDTGTIGGDNSITFSPGVLGSWRPDAYQLVNTVVRFSQNPTYTNRLYFDPGISGFTNFAGQTYTNTFLFRAVRVTGTNLPISPFAFVDSGSGTKHTALSSLISAGGSNQIFSASNLMSIISHSVTPGSLLAPGGSVTYSVTFSNGFFLPINLDEIVNDLPGLPGIVTYVPGSATYNSLAISNPSIASQTLRWAQPFTVPGNGTGTLTFQAIAPLSAGTYTNRVHGVLGNEIIDLTTSTSDNAPATSVFTIIPVSDLGLAKSGPATTPAAGNFNYTLTLTNLGPSPASGVTVTDTLPASVTFVSASHGGFLSGGNVIWTNLSVTASNSTTLTLTVTAPPDGASLTNFASVAGPSLDPNSTNNVTPPVYSSVTPLADLQLIKTAPPVIPNNLNFNYTLLVTNRGPSAATNVAVTDALPPNATFVSASNAGFLSGGNVLWTNLGTLAANTSLTLTLTVTAPASGGVTNTASVTSPISDPNGGNNDTPPVVSLVGNVVPTTVNDMAGAPRNTLVSVNVLANDSDANGDPLALISVTQTNGTASINGANVDFSPATNFLGAVVLTYTVTDGQGGTNTGLFTINITNRPPVALNDAAGVTNGVPRLLFPLVNDSDPDADVLTITNAVASNGTVTIDPGSTNLTFTATNSFNGTITYTVSDGYGGTATAIVAIVGNNIAPTAFALGITMPEDTSTNLVYNATDDGTNLTFAILGMPSNGVLSAFDANAGTVTYTPNTNYFGLDSFTYTVFDGQLYATSEVALTITSVNDGPVATNSIVTTLEDTATNLVLTASDVDSTNLTFAILIGPTNGGLSGFNTNSGGITYTPTGDYNGADSFTFTVFDGSLYATGVVSITVLPVNDLPLAANDNAVVNEDTAVSIPVLVNDSDPDGSPLTLVDVTSTNGITTINGTNVVYVPSTNFFGTNVITYCITDGATTNCAAITVAVLPVNDAPMADNQGVTIPEGVSTNLVLTASDVDGTNLTFSIISSPANGSLGTLNTNTGAVTYAPNTNYVGADSFTFSVFDGALHATGTVSVTVTPLNDAPLANSQSVTNLEDTPLPITLVGSDVDGPVTNFVVVGQPLQGLLSGTGANLTYTPTNNYFGPDGFTFTVNDGSLTSTVATVSIMVLPVNDAPAAGDDAYSTPKNIPLSISAPGVLANDTDVESNALTAVLVANVVHGTLSLSTNGSFTYTPSNNYVGPDSFTYRANDGVSNSAVATVNLNITVTNFAPVAVNDSVTMTEDSTNTISVLVNDTDPDGDVLTVTGVVTTNGIATLAGTNVVYTPSVNFFGTNVLTYCISDGAITNCALITVVVQPLNDAPVANNQSVAMPEDTATNLVLTASDVDSTNLTFAVVSGPANGTLGTLNTNTGSVTYMPNTNYVGLDGITFTIFDGALYATGTVSLTVTPLNDAPVANSQSVTNLEDTLLPITLTGSDADGPVTNFVLVTLPTHGTLSGVGANLVYMATTNFFGADSFTFTVNDGSLTSAVAAVNITVLPVNDAPVLVNDSATVPEDGTNSISVLANDSDVDGDPLTLIGVLTTNGTATVVGTNVVYTPASNFHGTNVLTYSVTDGMVTNSATITVVVTPVNDAPVLVNDTITVPEDSTNNIPVLVNDSDVDGDVLTLISVSTTNGTATVAGTNVVYTPALNFHGTNVLTYSATDGAVTNSATLIVVVTPVNDAPVLVNDFMLVYDQSTNTIPVLANDGDVDGDVLTLVSVSTTNGTASVVGSDVVYSPALGVIGTNVLTYLATDGTVTNNATITVVVVDVPIAFGIRRGTNVFNPQTGLYEQVVVVTNLTSTTVAAVRLLVGDFASTNGAPRTNVWLWNATGTNFDGRRFVQYNAPLNPGQFASILLEFYNPTRLPFTNSLEVQAVLPTPATTNLTGGVAIDRAFVDNRESGNPRFVIEWVSIPGRSYTVIYSDDAMLTWRAATPSVTASATRTQWYDDGPPKTQAKPMSVSSRLYRVILNP